MTLRDWLVQVDPIGDIIIWTNEDDEDSGPSYEGGILDVPWTLVDLPLATKDENGGDPPIYISTHKNQYGTSLPCVVVNVRYAD